MSTTFAAAPLSRAADWADPGFFSDRVARSTRFWRLLWFLVLPPDTQRTTPTLAGGLLVVVALGLGLAAYNNANNVLFMALSLLLSSLVLSGVMSWVNFRGVRWRLVLPPRFRAGDSAPLRIDLANGKKIVPTYSLLFHANVRRHAQKQQLFLPERLDPGQTLSLDWIFSPTRRGVETVEVAGVESQFPFGFLRKVTGGGVRHDILIWPARVDYEFAPPHSHRAHHPGETQRRPGPGADLLGLRPYRPGDAPRLVHWKASARLQHLVVRQTGEEQRAGFYFVLDSLRAVWTDDAQFERLCSFVAALGEDLYTQGRLLGYSIDGEPAQPIQRLGDLHGFFDRLARLEPVAKSQPPMLSKGNTITFRPGSRLQVHAYLDGQLAGTA